MVITLLLKKNYLGNNSKFNAFLLLLFLIAYQGYCQTTIIDPTGDGGFENGATFVLNGWASNTPGSTTNNQWVCNTGATPGFSGTRAAYVTNNRNGTPPPHTYTNNATRVSHLYKNITFPAGESDITLNFDWIAIGESGFFNDYDYMRVWIVPIGYTPTYGNQITANGVAPAGRVQIGGNFNDQNTWTNDAFQLPAIYAGNTARLVFEWRNDGSVGGNPPAGIDNVSLISDILITPPNDECSAAISLTVNPDYNCGTVEFGTTVNATASSQADDVTGSPNNDVWYSFVATNTAHRISLINIVAVNGSADMGIGVYNGSSGCAALTFVDDSDPNTLDLTGLTIGNQYYVRIYGWYNDSTDQANFEVCLGTPPPPPSNDDPCNAEPLAVNTSCSFSTYTTESATTTSTAGIPAPGCANYSGGDVWFTLTVPPSGSVIVDSDTGVITDGGMAIYSQNSACPGLNLTLIECDDDDSANGLMSRIELNGQTPGATLYVRFWEYGNNNNGEFDICAYEPTPPVNDDCANAILLTSNTNCISITGTTEYATQSQGGCSGTADDDVWYYFVATGTEHTITVDTNTLQNTVFQVFDSCAGTSLSCVNTATTGTETITFNTLTPGTSYYIRVYSFGNSTVTQGLFDICITEPCSSVVTNAPPTCTLIGDDTNNDPFAAVPFVADPQVALDCDNVQATLEAFSNFHETTDYRVERIPYSVSSGLGGGLTNQVIPLDDVWASNSTNIGFDFCFYGQTYTHFLVGANGNITFDIDDLGNGLTGSNAPGSYCGWQFDEDLPSTDGALFDQTIYGVYHDIDPRGLVGNPIQSELVGTGNCRKMVISWTDIPMFGDATRLYSGRIELYESTNIIEVHIEEKLIENGNVSPWNDGNAIVGIQGNSTAGEAITAPCRGINPNWEVPNTPTTREAWRFVPDGAPRVPSSVTWYTGSVGGTQVGTNNTLTVNSANTYYVQATYPTCSGSITVDDAVIVTDPRKIWDGSLNSNWYEDANWTPAGVPDLDDCVVIPNKNTTPNDPIADISTAPIPIPPTAPGYARNITLNANSYLEVVADTELLVREWVNVQNTGIFNLNSSASLIQMDDSAVNTGTIYVQRSPNLGGTPVGAEEYVYWSSPVDNFQVDNISPSSSLIYGWTPTVIGNGTGGHGEWFGASGAMNDATGYIIRGLGGTPANIPAIPTPYTIPANTALFSGVPNNGSIMKQIFHGNYAGAPYFGVGTMTMATNEDDNWNLIGNPYPSAISANAFVDLNTNINGTVYVWPHSSAYSAMTGDPFYEDYAYNYDGNDYIEHNNMGSNPAGINDLFIGSGQGFFVLMNHSATSGSTVTFNNSMRYDDTLDDLIINYENDNFFRVSNDQGDSESSLERHRIWLDLLSPNDVTNSILVGYADNATNEFDRLFDGYDFSGDDSGFYSISNDDELSIQGRALPFLQEDRVPLGVVANQTGNHIIAINTVDGLFLDDTQGIFIEDSELNIIHDLREAPYIFTITEGEHNDRFVLRYTDETLSVNSFDTDQDITIMAPNSEYIKVTSGSAVINSVAIYDIVGRVIYESNDTNSIEFVHKDSKLSSGTYIVKVQLQNGKQKIQKVVIRQ